MEKCIQWMKVYNRIICNHLLCHRDTVICSVNTFLGNAWLSQLTQGAAVGRQHAHNHRYFQL